MLGDGAVERDRAVESGVHEVDAPARRVHLLAPEHVRRARRQAEAAVDAVARELADHAAERLPLGSSCARIALAAGDAAERRRGSGRRRSARDVGDAGAGRTTASSSAASVAGEPPGREAQPAARGALALPRLVPDRRRRPRRPRRAPAPPRAAPATAARHPSKSTATRPGWRTSSALGCELRASSAPATDAGVVGLDDERARRLRERVEAEARRARSARAVPREPQTSSAEVVARDVLHDLARRRSRSSRRRARASRRGRGRAARRSGVAAGRRRSSRAARRSSGRRAGRARGAGPCRASAALSSDSRTPASTVQVRSPASCSRIAVEPVGRQVVADANRLPVRPSRPRSSAEASSRLETLGKARSSRARGRGTGRAPRRRAGGSGSPCRGCRCPSGSNARAEALEDVEVALGEHLRHRARLVHADAVLAGERAARVEAGARGSPRRARAPARSRPCSAS